MRPHLHTDFPSLVFAGLSAIVLIHVLRITAAQLSAHGQERAGKSLAAFALAD